MPPLRAHPEDIPLLVEYFIDAFNTEFRKRVLGATPAAYAVLQGYGWPGNVRELRNVIERAMLLSDGERLDARDFAAMTSGGHGRQRFRAAGHGRGPRAAGAKPGGPGASAERRQPDAGRGDARTES